MKTKTACVCDAVADVARERGRTLGNKANELEQMELKTKANGAQDRRRMALKTEGEWRSKLLRNKANGA